MEDIIKFRNEKNFTTKYVPLEYHVGAVSVGGVTTGGTYTTGGYSYVSSIKNSGKYSLVYDTGDGAKNEIRTIELTPELYAIAKQSAISQYLDERRSCIIVVENLSQRDLDLIRNSGYNNLSYVNNARPTIEKASIIMDWITGRI